MSVGALHLDPQELDPASIQTGALVGVAAFLVFLLIATLFQVVSNTMARGRLKWGAGGALAVAPFGLTSYPDVWYDPNQLAIVGTASWVFLLLVAAYFVLKWMHNTDKFYKALEEQEKAASTRMTGYRR